MLSAQLLYPFNVASMVRSDSCGLVAGSDIGEDGRAVVQSWARHAGERPVGSGRREWTLEGRGTTRRRGLVGGEGKFVWTY